MPRKNGRFAFDFVSSPLSAASSTGNCRPLGTVVAKGLAAQHGHQAVGMHRGEGTDAAPFVVIREEPPSEDAPIS
jgi:hypothetical protein